MKQNLTKERLEAALDLNKRTIGLMEIMGSIVPNVLEANHTITEALQTLIDAKTAPTWQPIETAPKDGEVVDLWFPKYGRKENWRWFKKRKTWWSDDDMLSAFAAENHHPTHWMPLPTPPEKSE